MRTGGVAQVVDHLLGKHEALSSTPIPPKKKKRAQHGKRINRARNFFPSNLVK
jgi:hypothetical protein